MPIDSFTVVLFGLLIKVLLGSMFLAFWFKNRDAFSFAWWSASLVLGSITSMIYMINGPDPGFFALAVGNACLIASLACCWQGARAFGGRPPIWSSVLLPPVLWF